MILPTHDHYQDYTEAELEEHRRKFPNHQDRMIVLHELQKWQKKRDDEIAKDRHRDNWILGRKTLRWAKVAGIAGVAAVIVAIATLLVDTPTLDTSKARPVTSSQASPTSSPQTQPNDVVSEPLPETKTVLAVLLTSPPPSSTSTPTMTPIKFPPPAP